MSMNQEEKRYTLRREHNAAHIEIVSGKMNILGTPEIEQLIALFQELESDKALRAVVLTGSGETAFVGGANIKEMVLLDQDSGKVFIRKLHALCETVRTFPVPVIARVNGWCLGGGLELAAACDFRIAGFGVKLGMPEVKMGIPSVIHAALLPGLIGTGRTRWWLLTGEIIDADTALAWGLVDVVAAEGALDKEVERALESLLECKPEVIRSQKRLCNAWDEVGMAAKTRLSVEAFGQAFTTGEPQACMQAFLDRKKKK